MDFIIIFILWGGPMLTAVTLFLLLEMGVNQAGSQKKLVYQFMEHPLRVESLILSLFLLFPIQFGFTLFSAVLGGSDPEGLTILVILVLGFPVLAYFLHIRISEFKSTLGIGRKIKHDPILVAKIAVVCWLISVGSFIIGSILMLTDSLPYLRYSLAGIGTLGTILIPFRKSLATIRNRDVESFDAKKSNQDL